MSFIIGCVIGTLLALFVLGESTLDRENKAYMEGYNDGLNHHKLSESSNN